jgi:hypothetical protein
MYKKQNEEKQNKTTTKETMPKKATRPTSPVIRLSVIGEEQGKGSQYFI